MHRVLWKLWPSQPQRLMARVKCKKHFEIFVFLFVFTTRRPSRLLFGSRTFFHRLFPHREFFQRHFSIGQMLTWIFTHHGFLPIMFCPSGKIPTWIYTHHNFAHILVDFYPSEFCLSENSSSDLVKPKIHQKFKIAPIHLQFSHTKPQYFTTIL